MTGYLDLPSSFRPRDTQPAPPKAGPPPCILPLQSPFPNFSEHPDFPLMILHLTISYLPIFSLASPFEVRQNPTSLMAQMVKRLSTMWETWVQSLGREDPLEKEMAAHSSILAWRIPRNRGASCATVHGVAKSRTRLSDFTFTSPFEPEPWHNF